MTINGLPAHVLLVHVVVVLVPLSALLVLLVALWPAARDKLAVLTAVLAVLALASVPVTTEAGDWLEHRLPRTPLLTAHTHLGDDMLPWAIGLALVAVALCVRHLVSTRSRLDGSRGAGGGRPPGGRTAGVSLAVLAVVVAVGSVTMVYRIGDSGARAAWTGQFSQQALPRTPAAHPAGAPTASSGAARVCSVDLCRASGDPFCGWQGGGVPDTAVVSGATTTPPGAKWAPRSRLDDPRDTP